MANLLPWLGQLLPGATNRPPVPQPAPVQAPPPASPQFRGAPFLAPQAAQASQPNRVQPFSVPLATPFQRNQDMMAQLARQAQLKQALAAAQSIQDANQKILAQKLQYGKLADPKQAQAFAQSNQPSNTNPLAAGAGALVKGVNNVLVKPVAKAGAVPVELARDVAAIATGNKPAAKQAVQRATQDYGQSIFGMGARAALQFGASVPIGNYQNRTLNFPNKYLNTALGGPIPTYQTEEKQAILNGQNPAAALLQQVPNVAGGALSVLGAVKGAEKIGNALPPITNEIGAIGKDVTKPNLNADMFTKENIAKYEAASAADLAKQNLPKTPVSESFAKTATGKAGEPYPTNPVAPIKLPEVKNATEAIRVSESAASDLSQRVDVLAKQEDALVGKSLAGRDKFIQAVENPKQAPQIAKGFGGDSQSFLNLVQQHRDLTNLEHAAQTGAGNPRGYFGGENGYFSHDVVINNPADKAAYDTLLGRTIRGKTALERTNPTLADLRANKLDITPDTLGNATRKWGARQSTILRDAALHDRLSSIDPSVQVAQVPGETPHFISGNKEFNKQLKGVQPYTTPTALRPLNAINTGLKQVGLFGGGFHDLKTSIRSVTTDIASLRNPVSRLVEANKQFVSDTAHTKWNQTQLDKGYGKLFADADVAKSNLGLDLRSSVGKDLTRGSVEKLNPYMNRLFSNKIDYFKKQLVIDEAKRNGITPDNYDPNNAAQAKIIRDAGDQAKNWFGGLNQRTLAKSPIFQQALKYVTLAPDFTEGKIRSVANAFTGGEKGSLARRQVISEAVGVAILAEAASKTTTGKYTNPVGAVLNPTIATNMKDKKGRPLAVGLPGSTVADVNRLVTDPTHFAISHSAAGPSTLISAATGKDYFGNSLVDPFKNPNPNFGQNLVAALKSKGTIPGVQISKTLSGQQNAATGIINTLGGRVGLDKNAQSYKDTQDFFNKQDTFTKGLNPNDKTTFNAVNPTKKDASGQPVYDPTIFQKAGTYGILRDNPAFTAKYQAYQQSQKNHDPLWDLPKNQLQEVLTLRSGKSLPSQTYTKAGASLSQATQTDQQWYKDLLAKEQTYFASLPKSNTPTASTTDYGPQPNAYVTQQLNTKNYKDPQVQQYFNDRAAYENKLRKQQGGLLPIASFGQVGVPGQLDNPGQLAITPKGSSYGTGAPKKTNTTGATTKISTPKIKVARASTRSSTSGTKSATGGGGKKLASFKVANSTKSILPKGIKVKAVSYKAPKLRKISVSKIPKFSAKIRKGKQIA